MCFIYLFLTRTLGKLTINILQIHKYETYIQKYYTDIFIVLNLWRDHLYH